MTMEKKFTSDEVPLAQILEQARTGKLQLPDFQRGWVWDDDHITSLLASISLSYPIGAVMMLQTGNPDVRFQPRTLEGVNLVAGEPEILLLDGQQRVTSLYLALRSGEPVPTRDEEAMGKPVNGKADASESPYGDPIVASQRLEESVRVLMVAPESKVLERKATGRKNLKTNVKDADIEWSIIRMASRLHER